MEKLEKMTAKIEEYHSVTREIVSTSCHGALLAKGFVVDERIEAEKGKSDKTYTFLIIHVSHFLRSTQEETRSKNILYRPSCKEKVL